MVRKVGASSRKPAKAAAVVTLDSRTVDLPRSSNRVPAGLEPKRRRAKPQPPPGRAPGRRGGGARHASSESAAPAEPAPLALALGGARGGADARAWFAAAAALALRVRARAEAAAREEEALVAEDAHLDGVTRAVARLKEAQAQAGKNKAAAKIQHLFFRWREGRLNHAAARPDDSSDAAAHSRRGSEASLSDGSHASLFFSSDSGSGHGDGQADVTDSSSGSANDSGDY
ncbi:hypothetical protein SO694_00084177 [Aureococcus anophagefferens]|uniref:Uncharacterized protein n=1 Tax=Aureococcus anophagefferens TaxID=44056 RepID=A0ABR1G4S7_AURAN